MGRDPVCGMEVRDTPEAPSAIHEGRTYVFCSAACRERFEEAPQDSGPRWKLPARRAWRPRTTACRA